MLCAKNSLNLLRNALSVGGPAGVGLTCARISMWACALTCMFCLSGAVFAQTATTVTLTVTSGESPVATVTAGTVVTLTAAVTAGTIPATPGIVNFCDATAVYCEDIHIVGSAQLTSAGTAVARLRPGVGSHSYKAVFEGTQVFAASMSNAASLSVTGSFPTKFVDMISEWTGAGYNDDFNGALQAIAPAGSPAPTGAFDILDTSFSNAVLLAQPLTAWNGFKSAQFGAGSQSPQAGSAPFSVATGDFNCDGISDLAVANSGGNTVGVFLGNGDGTFQSQVPYAAGAGAYAVAVGDFNDDGNLDLAVTNFSANTVSILLGNGDGTFQSQQTYATGGGPDAIAVGDFEGAAIPLVCAPQNASPIVCENFAVLSDGTSVCGLEALSKNANWICTGQDVSDLEIEGGYLTDTNPGTSSGPWYAALPVPSRNLINTWSETAVYMPPTNGSGASGTCGTLLGVAEANGNIASGNGTHNSVSACLGTYSISHRGPYINGSEFIAVITSGKMVVESADGHSESRFSGSITYPGAEIETTATWNNAANSITVASAAGLVAGGYISSPPNQGLTSSTQFEIQICSSYTPGSTTVPICMNGSPIETAAAASSPVNIAQGAAIFTEYIPLAEPDSKSLPGSMLGAIVFADPYVNCSNPLSYQYCPGTAVVEGENHPAAPTVKYGSVTINEPIQSLKSAGVLDLAITNETDDTVSILLGNGDGTFQPQQTFATGGAPDAIAIVNFNNSGALDLAVANNLDATVSVLMGNGDGTFQAQQAYAVGNNPTSIAVADLNNDGNPDLAVTNSADNTISVLSGQANGTFASQITYPVDFGPQAIVAGNLSAAGYADLGVVTSNGWLRIFENDGSGNFPMHNDYFPGAGALVSMVAGDWNGDGLLDVAALSTGGSLYPYLNTSGPSESLTGPLYGLAGMHTFDFAFSGDSNYEASSTPGGASAPMYPATLTITGSPILLTYGNPVNLTATLSVPGLIPEVLPNGQSPPEGESITFYKGTGAVLGSGTLVQGSSNTQYVATLAASLSAGDHQFNCEYASDGMLAKANSTGDVYVTVQPAALTLTGADASRAYDASNPPLTGTVSGAVNGDKFTVSATTTATQTSPVGQYPVVPEAIGASLSNYSVTTVNGTLTVTQATPAIAWATPASIAYGTALSAAQLDAHSTAAGSFTYSPASGTVLGPGTHTVTATFTPTDTTDYTTATSTVTLTVTQSTPAVAVTNSVIAAFMSTPVTFTAAVTSNAETPTGTVSFYDGTLLLGKEILSGGMASYTTSSLAAGSHSITAVYSGDANYLTVTSSEVTETIVTLTIGAASGGSTSATASSGGQAVYKLEFSPPSGETFPTAINLSVTGLPTGATAAFNPASIAAGASSTNVTLTVTLATTAAAQPLHKSFAGMIDGSALPVALGLILLPFARRPRIVSGRWSRMTGMAALGVISLAAVAAITSCGGGIGSGVTGPQPQNYALTVTATSGSFTSSSNLTLAVE